MKHCLDPIFGGCGFIVVWLLLSAISIGSTVGVVALCVWVIVKILQSMGVL